MCVCVCVCVRQYKKIEMQQGNFQKVHWSARNLHTAMGSNIKILKLGQIYQDIASIAVVHGEPVRISAVVEV